MNPRHNVSLAKLTTFKTGGPARVVFDCVTKDDVKDAVAYAVAHGLSFYVLGDGSNVLPDDAGYAGVIIRMCITGTAIENDGTRVRITSGAGVSWDEVVRTAAAQNAWGIENLAGIPGTMGAAPVQNIGAYGAELAQVLESVDVFDARNGTILTLTRDECRLGYRDSRFKHESQLIVLSVTLSLSTQPAPRIEYGDVRAAKERGEDLSTPEAIGNVVRAIRAKKFPDLTVFGTAGSFFKNPILTPAAYDALVAAHGDVPKFPNLNGVKIPLAFVLDKVLGLRGYRKGNAFLFGAQPLVLVLDAGGTSKDVHALAEEIESRVHDAIGVSIEREVRTMPKK